MTADRRSLRRDILLAAQVALLGELSAEVRGVTLDWSETEIVLRGIVDGVVSEDDTASMACVGSEIVASFPGHSIEVEIVRHDAPGPLRSCGLRVWVYERKERPLPAESGRAEAER